MKKKQLDEKEKVNSKIYVTAWLINNYNTRTAQYPTKLKQPDNEIWNEECFPSKVMQKKRQWDYFNNSFCFLKKLYMC